MGLTVALCFNLGKDLVLRDDEPPDLHCELDSETTIQAIRSSLIEGGHQVHMVEADHNAFATLQNLRPDIVFNVAEGLHGESRESYIPSICDALRLPYTGSGVLTLAVALDKAMAKRVFAFEGVPTPPFRVIKPGEEIDVKGLRFPLFAKPLREGSSMGITERSRVDTYEQLRDIVLRIHQNYRQPALVEEFLTGREFTVGILGNESPVYFPVMEINYCAVPEGHEVYSRQFKAEWSSWNYYLCPAPLSDLERWKLQETALAAFRSLNCKDFGRVDIRYDRDGQPCVMEINPIPGLSPGYSDYARMAEVAGYSHAALVNAILDAAVARYAICRQQGIAKTGDS